MVVRMMPVVIHTLKASHENSIGALLLLLPPVVPLSVPPPVPELSWSEVSLKRTMFVLRTVCGV